jgi:hypothetical protein
MRTTRIIINYDTRASRTKGEEERTRLFIGLYLNLKYIPFI